MGRKTYISIGKVLPHRTNVVLSRTPERKARNAFWNIEDTALLWAQTPEDALFLGDIISISKEQKEFFVIGGSEVFEMFKKLFNRVYITEVFDERKFSGEIATFAYRFDRRKWNTIEEELIPAGPIDEFSSRFVILERRRKKVRCVELNQYYTDTEWKNDWVSKQLRAIREDASGPLRRHRPASYQYKLFTEQPGEKSI